MRVWPLVVLACVVVVIGMAVTTFAPPVTTGGMYPSSVPVVSGNLLEFDGTDGWRIADSGISALDATNVAEHTHTRSWSEAIQWQDPVGGSWGDKSNMVLIAECPTALTITNVWHTALVGTNNFQLVSVAGTPNWASAPTCTTNLDATASTPASANVASFDDATVVAGSKLFLNVTSIDAAEYAEISVTGTVTE